MHAAPPLSMSYTALLAPDDDFLEGRQGLSTLFRDQRQSEGRDGLDGHRGPASVGAVYRRSNATYSALSSFAMRVTEKRSATRFWPAVA